MRPIPASAVPKRRQRSLYVVSLGLAITLVATSCTTAVPPRGATSTSRVAIAGGPYNVPATVMIPSPSDSAPLGPFLPPAFRVPTLTTFPTPTRIPGAVEPTVAPTPPAFAAPSDYHQLLAFVSNASGNDEIMVRSAWRPASGESIPKWWTWYRLTYHPARDESPAFSPDGSLIAFASDRDGDFDIYVSRADGSGFVRLIDSPADDRDPTWSPDGKRLAFRSNRDGNNDIYVFDVLSGEVERLTDLRQDDMVPAWSPDGKHLAFMSARDGNLEIYTMDADGSNPVRVTCSPEVDGYPSWSPDGRELAFHSRRTGNYDIYRIQVAAVGQPCEADSAVPLTGHTSDDMTPAWDRGWIWWMSAREESQGFGVFRMPADGGESAVEGRLGDWSSLGYGKEFEGFPAISPATPTIMLSAIAAVVPEQLVEVVFSGEGDHATFSSDGRWIALQQDSEDLNDHVIVIPAPGFETAPGRWPDQIHAEDESAPTWSPDGTSLAFRAGQYETFDAIVIEKQNGFRTMLRIPTRYPERSGLISLRDLQWTHDGGQLFFAANPGAVDEDAIYTLDQDGKNLRRWIEGGVSLALSPDGSRLAYVVNDENRVSLRWRYLDGGPETAVLGWARSESVEPFVNSLAWDPASGRIVYGLSLVVVQGWGETTYFLNSVNPDGSDDRAFVATGEGILDPRWSPDGRLVIAIGEESFVLLRPDGTDQIRLGQSILGEFALSMEWSPDGQSVLYSTDEGVFILHIGDLIKAVYGF